MPFDKLIRPSVGPDLSRPAPMYRPRWLFCYPGYFVHLHYRPLHLLYARVPTPSSYTPGLRW